MGVWGCVWVFVDSHSKLLWMKYYFASRRTEKVAKSRVWVRARTRCSEAENSDKQENSSQLICVKSDFWTWMHFIIWEFVGADGNNRYATEYILLVFVFVFVVDVWDLRVETYSLLERRRNFVWMCSGTSEFGTRRARSVWRKVKWVWAIDSII